MGEVTNIIEKKLTAALSPTRLEVINDSDKHLGHAGHDGSGESHFTVIIEAEAFRGQSRVAQQRLVMGTLKEELKDKIHALAIKASAPN